MKYKRWWWFNVSLQLVLAMFALHNELSNSNNSTIKQII